MKSDVALQSIETTLYSLSGSVPKPLERRDGERQMTLYRVGSLYIDNRRELCLIKNISCGGMMVRAYSDFAEGTPVQVELKSGEPIAGRISWFDNPNAGITFDAPVDVVGLLSASQRGGSPANAANRSQRTGHGSRRRSVHHMRICDISQGGLKVAVRKHDCARYRRGRFASGVRPAGGRGPVEQRRPYGSYLQPAADVAAC